ncbi:hypothetical protein CPSG_01802 [Coccidioides posadasii str. Silveira]|uniref:Uncharacterized protein n=1 Tax=Coccidioides posadasii (strain RMSCC 757 / Silveira) TaxID=443226 RepID=E9CWG9_COCPS|nr:hypothetical protein CPSG_01802 [Coccidioides posadasii str. Silveira]
MPPDCLVVFFSPLRPFVRAGNGGDDIPTTLPVSSDQRAAPPAPSSANPARLALTPVRLRNVCFRPRGVGFSCFTGVTCYFKIWRVGSPTVSTQHWECLRHRRIRYIRSTPYPSSIQDGGWRCSRARTPTERSGYRAYNPLQACA